jgi:hypothetical protein
MALSTKQFECIVVSVLAVNQYPLVKAQSLLPNLEREGITSVERLRSMSLAEVIEALVTAGYDRKRLTWMFGERLKLLADSVAMGALDQLSEALHRRDESKGRDLLEQLPGIGPHVAQTAWTLMRLL